MLQEHPAVENAKVAAAMGAVITEETEDTDDEDEDEE